MLAPPIRRDQSRSCQPRLSNRVSLNRSLLKNGRCRLAANWRPSVVLPLAGAPVMIKTKGRGRPRPAGFGRRSCRVRSIWPGRSPPAHRHAVWSVFGASRHRRQSAGRTRVPVCEATAASSCTTMLTAATTGQLCRMFPQPRLELASEMIDQRQLVFARRLHSVHDVIETGVAPIYPVWTLSVGEESLPCHAFRSIDVDQQEVRRIRRGNSLSTGTFLYAKVARRV